MKKFLSFILIICLCLGLASCANTFKKSEAATEAKPQIDAAALYDDVNKGDWYEDAVSWGVSEDVMTPAKPNLFGVDNPMTRAEVVLAMWKAAGSPGRVNSAKAVADDSSDSDISKALEWAVSEGILTREQVSYTSAVLTRQDALDYMYIEADSPAVQSQTAAYSDVSADNSSVRWAKDSGITYGIGHGLFGPELSCTKAMMITFLFRAKP